MLNILVACTNGKRSKTAAVHLGELSPHQSLARIFSSWIRLLQEVDAPRMKAIDLYKGDHWHCVQSLTGHRLPGGGDIQVWVCSAGYGLLSPHASLRPYSASFVRYDEDYVGVHVTTQTNPRKEWWRLHAQWEGPRPGDPRSVAELARRFPETPLLVVLPEAYLDALTEDLFAAKDILRDEEFLTLLVAGNPKSLSAKLSGNTVRLPKKVRQVVGGSDHSLYGRTVRHLVFTWATGLFTTSRIRDHICQMCDAVPELPVYGRERANDQDILLFIRQRYLGQDPMPSASVLLRQYRDLGFACEQKRFSRLHRLVREEARPCLAHRC